MVRHAGNAWPVRDQSSPRGSWLSSYLKKLSINHKRHQSGAGYGGYMKNTSHALRTILSRATTVLLLSLIGIAATLVYRSSVASGPALAQTTETYTWRNVAIGGGGGFVPGIVFNTTEQNLIYARTDIGGAYRWDQTAGRWVPLLDWVGFDAWNLTGDGSVASVSCGTSRVF